MATGSFITPTGGSAGGSTLIPYAAYLNTVSGNNSTAVLGDGSKPYLTMTALIAALPAGNDFTWTIYITGSTIDISMPIMPPRNLTFNADIRYIYNFNFDTGTGGVITATTSYFTYTFLNSNINLKSNAAANRNLGYGFQINGYLQIRGHINIIDWSNEGSAGSSVSMVNSDVTINEFIKRTAGSGLYIGNATYARIKKVTYIGFFDGFLRSTNTFLSRITVDLISCATSGVNPLQATSSNLDLEIKEIQVNGSFYIIYTLPKLTLSDLICSGTTTNIDVGEALIVTGRIVSDTPLFQLTRLSAKTLQNLEAKITGCFNNWGNSITVDNCRLTVVDYLSKNAVAGNPKVVIFKGNNIIKQTSKTLPLIHSYVSTAPSSVDISGTLNIEPNSTLVDQYTTVNYLNEANPSYRGIASALQSQTFLT
jgi:hypothetical protein